MRSWRFIASTCWAGLLSAALSFGGELERIRYNNPGLTVDLGVGLWAWPLPMDYDGDGDLDLVVGSGGKPYEGTYFFENPGGGKLPAFKPGRKVAAYKTSVQLSPDGTVMTPGVAYPDFKRTGFEKPAPVGLETKDIHTSAGRVRANQWKRVDYDGDGRLDLVVGIGDWADYGWDDAYNEKGEWTNGPLHGYVYWARGTDGGYEQARPVMAGGDRVDVFGMPSPNFADFDGDGDLDLICGEFLDGFTFFENTGSRTEPKYAAGRRLKPRMDLQMITPTAVDWDGDGDPDLISGDEDGRVAFIENLGGAEFADPVYFQQEAEYVKFGALATPVGFDWDGDGDEDIVAGNTAGYIGLIENLDGGDPPKWAAPRYLEADGERIRIMAGPNGSIQGPAEAKWGYTALSVADWDGDGLPDLVVNSIWGKVVWYRNTGTRTEPRLAKAQPVRRYAGMGASHGDDWTESLPAPEWVWWAPSAGRDLVTQWRTTPLVLNWLQSDALALVMLDHEGYLAYHEVRDGAVMPGERLFWGESRAKYGNRHQPEGEHGGPLQLNTGRAGKSGRRKLAATDWDGDGRMDVLVNSTSVHWLRNVGEHRDERGRVQSVTLRDEGPLTETQLAGHTTSPTTVDWDGNGVPDLLIGAEDGFFYYMKNPRSPE